MRNLLLGAAAAGLIVAGVVAAPAWAGPTTDQAAAESDLPPAAPSGATPAMTSHGQAVLGNADLGTALSSASNGAAQSRIVAGMQVHAEGQ